MAVFVCTKCGNCCRAIGRQIEIERRLGPKDCYCRFLLTGERSLVHLEPGFSLPDEDEPAETGNCPFLQDGTGGTICMIYATRPRWCREFQCIAMQIADRQGEPIGKVSGRRSLSTANPDLQVCWEQQVKPLISPDDRAWMQQTAAILRRAGYQVRVYDGTDDA
jgi:uncharacterized protein